MQWKEKKRREKRREEQNKKQTTHSIPTKRTSTATRVTWNEKRLCVYFWIVGFCAERQAEEELAERAFIDFGCMNTIWHRWFFHSFALELKLRWYKNPSVHLAEENEEIKMEKRWADGIGIGEKMPHAELTKLSNKKKNQQMERKGTHCEKQQDKKSTFGAGKMELKRLLHRATFITISAIKI